jgi:hypothetical protein
MKKFTLLLIVTAGIITFNSCQYINKSDPHEGEFIGELSTGATLSLQQHSENNWGMLIKNAGSSSLMQPEPVQIELYKDSTSIIKEASGYEDINTIENGFTGKASVTINGVIFNVTDTWKLSGKVMQLSRKLQVEGSSAGGFLSAITFNNNQPVDDVRYFAPGMIFGNKDNLTKVAIGGHEAGTATWIREDRLPAPLFGVYSKDGTSVTMLDPSPQGHTTKEDSRDRQVKTLVDERFRFGAIGAEANDGSIQLGFKWPGTEGETTYRGYHYPGGQVHKWRRRYHPVRDGFEQVYKVSFRFDKEDEKFVNYYNNAWRWAWDVLKPQVNPQDIEVARRSLIDMLAERVEIHGDITGLSNMTTFEQGRSGVINHHPMEKTVMGFTGKALESANFLLQDADMDPRADKAKSHRKKALAIIDSYQNLELSPPAGEGFFWKTGEPAPAIPRHKRVYLRSFGDDLKSLLKAAKREKANGREHPDWVAWAQTFADWLLPQQSKEGGLPRAWEPGTGKVVDDSPASSYTIIPYLLLLTELTGDEKYQQAAIKAGEFVWDYGQSEGIFVGGTIDNPDVIDKEAGTLSLEAHLALYNVTQEEKWLERAEVAAGFAETWMYIWNVPMPEDENAADLHWKKGVPNVGIQLISTGHSLADAYMAFDADEYAQLAVHTGDEHYKEVAAILLHNTKGMMGLPGRTYDLPGPGWQQEHWSFAPERGIGRKRAWLPWVSTSHLNGIFGLMDFDPALYDELTQKVDFNKAEF